jgi:ABC-type glycerol-3-phosphate transport system substrate-binding protein
MRRRLGPVWTLFLAAALLAACAGPAAMPEPAPLGAPATTAPTTGANGGPEPVTIGFAAPEFERAAYQPLIDTFNAENPDVQVRFVSLDEVARPGGGSFDPGEMLRDTVSAADTAAPFVVRAEDLASGLLLDLAPLMDADPSFERDDFYPGAFESASVDGAVYVVPRAIGVPLLAYNKELFDAAGVAPPTPGWTWEEFLAAAERLASRRGDEVDSYGFAAPESGLIALFGVLAASGDPLTQNGAARLDRPEVAVALERVAGLIEAGALFTPGLDGAEGFERMQELIRSGRAAMWLDGTLFTPPGQESALSSGLAPLPEPNPPSGLSGETSGYVISAGTQHPEATWRWLSFVSRQEIRRPGNIVMIGGGRTVPARRSLAQQSGFWRNLDAEATAAVEAGLERRAGTPRPGAEAERRREALAEALTAATGGAPATKALANAQAALERRMAEAEPSPTPSGPVAVATPEPEVIPDGATTVTFMAPGFDTARLRELARDFARDNPEVYVDVQGGFAGGPLDANRLAEQADCFMLPFTPEASAPLTNTLDLRPLIDADASFDAADLPAALLAPFERDGALRGLPYGVTLRALNYNQDAFEDAGLEAPRAGWALEELLQAALALAASGDASDPTYGFASNGLQTDDLRFFLDRMGARLTEGSGDALRSTLTDERVVAAVRYYMELLATSPHDDLSGYDRNEPLAIGGSFALVEEGRVGMWFDFGFGAVRIRIDGPERRPFTRAIAPPPLGEGSLSANDMQVSGMYIAAVSAAPEACWAWLRHLSRDISLLQGAFPARASLAESSAYLAQARPGAEEVYAAYRDALRRAPAGPAGELALDPFWFYRAVDRALEGENLELELEAAQRLSEQFLECVKGGGGHAECATAVDPEYGGYAE